MFKRVLEDAAKKAKDAVEFEENESKRLEEENVKLEQEKEKMRKRIEQEQGDLSKYQVSQHYSRWLPCQKEYSFERNERPRRRLKRPSLKIN
jgi:hypothetical protein